MLELVSPNAIILGPNSVTRDVLNTSVSGKAVTAKIVAGLNVTLTSTGPDAGTGDVTISAGGANVVGFRNRVHNGDMRVAQRPLPISCPAAAATYNLDRWVVAPAGSAISVTQVAGPAGFQKALQLTGATGNTSCALFQRIESVNCADLAYQSVVLSATLLASGAQTVKWELFYANVADVFTSSTTIANGTWSVTTSATRFQSTATSLPAGAANGLILAIYPQNNGAFTSGTLNVTGVQLEWCDGSASMFEQRPITVEQHLCQRYFQKFGGNALADFGVTGYALPTTPLSFAFAYPATMRALPSYSVVGTWNTVNLAAYFIYVGQNSGMLQLQATAATLTYMYTQNTSTYLALSADL
jgi:hypothetical protein